jgi:hypothetical protein
VFEAFKARRAATKQQQAMASAASAYQQALADWQERRDGTAALIESATAEGSVPEGLVLHRGELCFGTLTNCSLIEERRGQGHFVAGSAGISIPIGSLGGHPIRYRVGSTRGHYEQAAPVPTAVATGTLYFTDQRLVFLSPTQTRECRFDKVLGIDRDDEHGQLTISVSNRVHPTVLAYGPTAASWVEFRVALAMAHWRGDADQLIAQLNEQLVKLDESKPIESAPSPSAGPATSSP